MPISIFSSWRRRAASPHSGEGVPPAVAASRAARRRSRIGVELADQAGLTLLGFVRGETLNSYSHAERMR